MVEDNSVDEDRRGAFLRSSGTDETGRSLALSAWPPPHANLLCAMGTCRS